MTVPAPVGEKTAPRLDAIPPRVAAVAGGIGIATFAVLGVAYAEAKDGGPVPSWFRLLPIGLNGELTLPAFFSGFLLLAAGLLALRASEAMQPPERFRPLTALGVLFTFMAADEVLTIHEHLEAVTGVEWWKLYAPLALAGGVCALLVVHRVAGHALVQKTFLAGGACWLMAQLIETQQYDGAELVHRWTILPEEVLEMTGSLCFVVALLLLLRDRAAPDA